MIRWVKMVEDKKDNVIYGETNPQIVTDNFWQAR